MKHLPLGFSYSLSRRDSGQEGYLLLWRGETLLATIEVAALARPQLGASLRFDPGEGETVLGWQTPLGSLWLGLKACPLDGYKDREISAKVFLDEDAPMLDVILSTHLWNDPNEWHSDDPWWRRTFVHLTDRLLGKVTHTSKEIDRREVEIPFPEGVCKALVTIERVTFRRPGWPYPRVIFVGNVTPAKGPVVPGKGENSWDCEDDALHGMSCRAADVEEAAGKFLASVLHDRQRRAGTWVYPRKEQKAAE